MILASLHTYSKVKVYIHLGDNQSPKSKWQDPSPNSGTLTPSAKQLHHTCIWYLPPGFILAISLHPEKKTPYSVRDKITWLLYNTNHIGIYMYWPFTRWTLTRNIPFYFLRFSFPDQTSHHEGICMDVILLSWIIYMPVCIQSRIWNLRRCSFMVESGMLWISRLFLIYQGIIL